MPTTPVLSKQQTDQVQFEIARRKARTAFLVTTWITTGMGVADYATDGNTAAFFAFILAALMAVVVRSMLAPGGVVQLLRAFGYRGAAG